MDDGHDIVTDLGEHVMQVREQKQEHLQEVVLILHHLIDDQIVHDQLQPQNLQLVL
jgi:hypothetical protein